MVTMIHRSAVVSGCGRYRYLLERVLEYGTEESTPVVWVLCNPSTADGREDDPTVRKCAGFTANLGYKRFIIINAFAYRATKPRDLLKPEAFDPIGPDNWKWIAHALTDPETGLKLLGAKVIVGWGQAVPRQLRPQLGSFVVRLREIHNRPIYCYGLTDQWMPRHPLMLSYATPLELY